MSRKKKGLGRGLDQLIGDKKQLSAAIDDGRLGARNVELPLGQIQPGPWQPRRRFDNKALETLSRSIAENGLLQPVVVCSVPGKTEKYWLIAGERRWRAAGMAKLASLPALLLEVEEREAALLGLVENLQRVDLNAIEQAEGLRRLIEEHKMTHKDAATRVGLTRSAVSNLLRLLSLPEAIQDLVRDGSLDMGNARALLSLPDRTVQLAVAKRACEQTTRQTEAMVASLLQRGEQSPQPTRTRDADILGLEQRLSDRVGAPVAVTHGVSGRGRMVISYRTTEQLQGILERLGLD